MATVNLKCGICGFYADIVAEENDDGLVDITFKTDCPNFKKLEKSLTEVDPMLVCFGKIGSSEIYDISREVCPHAACTIPSAITKAVEVAANLALPKDVVMTITK